MSQEFDIHRELWDYCDDNSKRIVHFHSEDSNNIFDNPDEMIKLMEKLDEKEAGEPQKKRKKNRLDTAADIFTHMKDVTQNRNK